jgi:ABC-type antimicrobial peptide transport system permease subunit
MFWLQYEESFDDFHSKADRIYIVQYIDSSQPLNVRQWTQYPFAYYLKANYPEIEEISNTQWNHQLIETPTGPEMLIGLHVDTSFAKIFDLSHKDLRMPYFYPQWKEGSVSSEVPMPEKDLPVVITSNMAKRLFGKESSIGKEIRTLQGNTMKVEKEVLSWPENTNIKFDYLMPFGVIDYWQVSTYYTYALLKPGVDVEALNEKLRNIDTSGESMMPKGAILSPLRTFKIDYPTHNSIVKYGYIRLFAISGLLIAFCALFNYIMLFISRIKMRSRELALRKVNGASEKSLLLLLYTEFLLILLCTLIIGYLLIYLLLPGFKELSGVNLPSAVIYLQALKYILLLTAIILLISSIPIYYYQRQTLYSSINKSLANSSNNIFYKVCVSLQMIVSIGFIFCTLILAKQTNHLMTQDVGFDWHRVASVSVRWVDMRPYADKIAPLPSVENVLKHQSIMMFPGGRGWSTYSEWNGKPLAKPVPLESYDVFTDFIDFFHIKIKEGRNFDKGKIDKNEIIINEATVKAFEMDDPIGKTLGKRVIIGIIKDFHPESPEMEVPPIILEQTTEFYSFVYRYKEGMKKECEEAITKIIHNDDKDAEPQFTYMDNIYENYYSSENALLKLLIITTLVCIVISIFGIYSMVTLICAKRRREIAIRKVNGANAGSIIWGLVKEYLILLIIASVIVFPIGYKIMSTWLENYVNRISIGWWLYVLIIVTISVIVSITVFLQVWRAANQNPAEVLKSE